jgi:predicted transglutaminase-like cysteine proteinase
MNKEHPKVILEGKSKGECEDYARGFRRAMRQRGLPVKGKVSIVKTSRGFAAVYRGKDWHPPRLSR